MKNLPGSQVGCFGKKRFKSYPDAQDSAKRMNYHNEKAKGNAYRCPDCGFFHTGNSFRRPAPYKREDRHGRVQLSEEGS